MKKTFSVLNAIFILTTFLSAFYYRLHGGIELKALTSFGFVIIGAINLFYTLKAKNGNRFFAFFMMSGLVFSFLGDVILNYNFILGAIVFALGHLAYLAAYCRLLRFKRTDIIHCALIFIVSAAVLLLCPVFEFGSNSMKFVCLFYALIISFMVGKAIANLQSIKNLQSVILAVGSLLFFISDIALVFYVFAGASEIANTVCLMTYVPAQCVLAFSMILPETKSE